MFFANDLNGERTHIDVAVPKESYFCPACGVRMIQKRGNVISHHFAHKSQVECDPWYEAKMSPWHYRMQNLFDANCREIVIWNDIHTEYHVADVVFQKGNMKYVVEFQHSSISEEVFLDRTNFYTSCGYHIIWVFDFCENTSPKDIYMVDKDENLCRDDYLYTDEIHDMDDEDDEEYFDEQDSNPLVHFEWPGKDRIRFLDHIDIDEFRDKLSVFFFISTGKSDCITETYQWHSRKRWYYVNPNPIDRQSMFALLNIPEDSWHISTKSFNARTYTEEEFAKLLR